MSQRDCMMLAVRAGEVLLQNGAEIARVEDTIGRILDAFHVSDHHIYVISNGIFVTASENSQEPFYAVRHIAYTQMNLSRIVQVNALAREIVAVQGECNVADYATAIEECSKSKVNPFWLQLLACALGAGGFAYILGGTVQDSAAAFCAGLALKSFQSFGIRHANPYITCILSSALVTLASAILCRLGLGTSLDHIIIGAIMPLVPGVVMTTAIRSLFNADFLSGGIHLTDAFLTASSIAVGVSTTLYLWNLTAGGVL